jgi:putative flippase GtrA
MTEEVSLPWHRNRLIQFGEYMAGGGLYFLSGYLIFFVCFTGLHWKWWQAKIFADIIGWTLNYLVQRYWAFESRGLTRHEGRNKLRYLSFTVINIGLDYFIIGGLNRIGISPYVGMFIAAAFFTGWNYIGYRFFVFPEEYNNKYHGGPAWRRNRSTDEEATGNTDVH